MTANDRAALEMAVEMCRQRWKGGPATGWGSWEENAKVTAGYMQGSNLHLMPWQIPPAKINNPDSPDEGLREDQPGPASDGRKEAAALLKRMLSLGVSRWHPDPEAAIAAAERTAKTALLR
jgi:hypothetical protein